MTLVFIPALIVLLAAKEKALGRDLTRDEVETLRDNATAMAMPEDVALKMNESRGYSDVDPENVWNDWLAYKRAADDE
ncbi:hypothetical protein BN137_4108 [Cronobacter condimenti 1330]|uniref:Uncharacterized protein n=1 Tax=Cronobacter condimenti 1330 TaxID=1073999 RepID=K8A3T3_9ENTR|nr:hypothetical protein [Cronobacter condimenti]ALB62899.1 hypothetical protein AFK62_10450 [Cronobacter condimenti 1330]CCJ74708.1 hypothetical protein BN137_4108 [Cronobacter condimenti 1330]